MASRELKSRLVIPMLVVCVCAFSLLGCDKAQIVRFYNNTGGHAVIQLGGSSWELKKPFPYKQEVELGAVFFTSPVYVYFNDGICVYEDIGNQNFHPYPWETHPDKYQIELNGACYFIPPELDMPVNVFPEQPKGYPKFPERKKID